MRRLEAFVRAAGMAVALMRAVPALAAPDAVPPGWALVHDFLVQDACTDADGKMLPGAAPVDGPGKCPRHRDLRPDERLPYHKNDWPRADQLGTRPNGYHRNDTYPIRTRLFGIAVMQSRGFVGLDGQTGAPRPGRAGGGIWLFSDKTVASGLTEDPTGIQFFFGPDCASADPARQLLDAWVIVDKTYAADRPGETVARLTRYRERCPRQLDYAYTAWRTMPLQFRVRSAGVVSHRMFQTLVSDHFGGRNRETAGHLERFYLTRELGMIRWERWQNFARHKRPEDPAKAGRMASSDQCDRIAPLPASSGDWHMVACRQWTNLVPPAHPAGDPPGFWIDTIRTNPRTAPFFAR